MRAVGYTENLPVSDERCLVDVELPDPSPGESDLLVRLLALAVNPVDAKVRRGAPPEPGQLRVLGWDACGVVEAMGSAVEGFAVGERVWYAGDIRRQGCNAELQAVDARLVSAAPTTLAPEEAASLPLTVLTAWESLFERLGYSPEESPELREANRSRSFLVINGAGGVGSVVLQLCRLAGIEATATASRPESQAWCREMGASHVIPHGELGDLPDASFDRILCCHDTDRYFDEMTRLVGPFGRICCLASATRPHDIQPLMPKSAGLVWELMFTRSSLETPDMARQGEILATVARLVDEGRLRTTLSETTHGLTAANLRAMHCKQEAGRIVGKQTLIVGPVGD